MQVHDRYRERGVVFVSLTEEGEGDLEQIQAFAGKFQISWPIAYGARNTISQLKVLGPPMTFVVARDGTIAWNSNELGTLDGAIRKVL